MTKRGVIVVVGAIAKAGVEIGAGTETIETGKIVKSTDTNTMNHKKIKMSGNIQKIAELVLTGGPKKKASISMIQGIETHLPTHLHRLPHHLIPVQTQGLAAEGILGDILERTAEVEAMTGIGIEEAVGRGVKIGDNTRKEGGTSEMKNKITIIAKTNEYLTTTILGTKRRGRKFKKLIAIVGKVFLNLCRT